MNFPASTLEALASLAGEDGAGLFDRAADPFEDAECLENARPIDDALRESARRLAAAVPARQFQGLADDRLLEALSAIEHLGRCVDALRIEAAAEVAHRSVGFTNRSDGLASRKGARNAVELIERVTRVSGSTAARRIKLGQETRVDMASAGSPAPARFRFVADALESGVIGVDAASAIVASLLPVFRHGSIDGLSAAEEELVSCAIGTSDLVPTACTADEIRNQAMVWQAYLDPDGMEPVTAGVERTRIRLRNAERRFGARSVRAHARGGRKIESRI